MAIAIGEEFCVPGFLVSIELLTPVLSLYTSEFKFLAPI
ncbi:hypothetical protein EYZ11_008474 [Aspergillus tanneri]|uniref:Uncharacterized protein n=1 Tax=Aspergillus tanneri TaxID=1220188 RepID=A0A4S3JAF6_9EURO|nr:hypothetical protein EYZ11_008474 [Aspergillus tanneri]